MVPRGVIGSLSCVVLLPDIDVNRVRRTAV
jgi:hypothetical protein